MDGGKTVILRPVDGEIPPPPPPPEEPEEAPKAKKKASK